MTEEKIQSVVSNFEDKFRVWLSSQEGQTSAYDYEKSYAEFMRTVSFETLSKAVKSDGKSRNTKKNSNLIRQNGGQKKSPIKPN